MRKRKCVLMFLPFLMHAQEQKGRQDDFVGQGIKFEQALTWQQVRAKGKVENKYVFVDAFATWCAPCRWMDENVYNSEKVGSFFNEKFVSVKVQMDSTKGDNEQVKNWHQDAGMLMRDYKVTAFPTYLFFAPDGKIVHKAIGQRTVDNFIALANDAMEPKKQLYRVEEEYNRGVRDTSVMKLFAMSKFLEGDRGLAQQIADDYVGLLDEKTLFAKENVVFMAQFRQSPKIQHIVQQRKNYLDNLDQSTLLAEENLYFIRSFSQLVSSKDKFFDLFRDQGPEIDRMMGDKGFSERIVKYVIRKEEIDAKLWKNDKPVTKTPDWKKISGTIRKKYGEAYVNALVSAAQLGFYKRIRDWQEFARLRDDEIRNNPPVAVQDGAGLFVPNGSWMLNVDAWDVFLYCNDKKILSKALKWIDLAIKLEEPKGPESVIQLLDTKANVLYKLGRVKEALEWEEKAIEAGIASAQKQGREKGDFYDEYTEIINKMKKGEPTWPAKEQ